MAVVDKQSNWLHSGSIETMDISQMMSLEENPALGLSIWEQIFNEAILAGSPDFPEPEHSSATSLQLSVEHHSAESTTQQVLWKSLPKHIPPTCALDRAMPNMVNTRRMHETTGGNDQEFRTAVFPSVQSLLNPSSDVQAPLATSIVRDIVSALSVHTLPEQIAVLYIMGVSLRWQISPTRRNYDAMPEWLRPTPSQIFTPHAMWLDTLAWPTARERLCRTDKWGGKDVLVRHICEESFSVNWPYEGADIFLHNRSEPSMNPVFEQHIRNIKNWTLGPGILDVYPDMANAVNIRPCRAYDRPLR